MSRSNDFSETVRRIRGGDQEAAAELVRKYEPLIRREVRLHLEDRRLLRTFDSVDISQSVLASFFLRTAAGQYDLDSPAQLTQLLVRMTRNKLASAARKAYQFCRDTRKTEYDDGVLQQIAADDSTPSANFATAEMLEALRERLTVDERQLANLRRDGLSWNDIAGRLGGLAQVRRMQLTRGIERAARKLGLAEFYG